MAIIYRYVDLYDNKIKYIGVVWADSRKLNQRVSEHYSQDEWCKNGYWKIEYLEKSIKTRTDAEHLKAHYINKFGTDKFYNENKSGWGESSFIDDEDEEWLEYKIIGNTLPIDVHFDFEEKYFIRKMVKKEKFPEEVAEVLIKSYDFAKTRWGAGFLISSVLYVVFSEMGYDTKLYVGEVLNRFPNINWFDHSWITVDDKIIDVSLNFALNGERLSHTVFLDKDVSTKSKTTLEYGLYFLGLGEEALNILNTSFTTFMDLYPDSENGAWDIVKDILDKDIDIKELRNKYKKTNRIYVNDLGEETHGFEW